MLRKSPVFFLVLLLIFQSGIYSQQIPRQLLVHSRYDPGDTSTEMIIGYTFHKGEYIGNDTLIWLKSWPGSKTESGISIGFGEPIIHERYMFTSKGLLIDLQEKKVLKDINGELWKIEGNKLYFSSGYNLNKVELDVYDLSDHSYKPYQSLPFENKKELVAPDLKHGLSSKYVGERKKNIILTDVNGKSKIIFTDTTRGPLVYPGSRVSAIRDIFFWFDSAHFIFPRYIWKNLSGVSWYGSERSEKPDTYIMEKVAGDSIPCCSAELIEINIHTGQQRYVGTINGVFAPFINDRFFVEDGKIFFRNIGFDSSQVILFDPFTGETTRDDGSGKNKFSSIREQIVSEKGAKRDSIFYAGEHIGTFYIGDSYRDKEIVAIEGRTNWNDEQAMHVWSSDSQRWVTIPVQRLLNIMGWINKKTD